MDSDFKILHFHQQMELLGFIMNETLKSLVAIAMARGGASDLTAAQNANYFVTAASISQASPVTDVNRCNGTVNYQMGSAAYVPVDATHVTATAFTPYLEPIVLLQAH